MAERRGNPAWTKGVSGNPAGVPSDVRRQALANARKATDIRAQFLDALESRIATARVQARRDAVDLEKDPDELEARRIMELLTGEVNRFLVDCETRGLGAPKSTVAVELPSQRSVQDYSDEELMAIAMGHSIEEADFVDVSPDSGIFLLATEEDEE